MESVLAEKRKINHALDRGCLKEGISPESPSLVSFSSYIKKSFLVESQNSHMENIEDLVFNGGLSEVKKAIDFFRDLKNILSGNSSEPHNLSVEWDCSVSVVCGKDPKDDRFFVSEDSTFNTTEKVYKTIEEVKADFSGELQKKMILALKYLPEINTTGNTIRGNFIYDRSSLGEETIGGTEYITFCPNSTVYVAPEDSKFAKRIKRSYIGIAWYTENTAGLEYSQNVLSTDISFKDVSGLVNFTKKETTEVNNLLNTLNEDLQRMGLDVLNDIRLNSGLLSIMKSFINSRIKNGRPLVSARKLSSELKSFVKGSMYDDKTKSYFDARVPNIIAMLRLMVHLSHLKMIFVEKLNSASDIDMFLKTETGYKVTQQEGFVAIDKTKSGAVKLVDRLEFPKDNYSKEFLTGWQ